MQTPQIITEPKIVSHSISQPINTKAEVQKVPIENEIEEFLTKIHSLITNIRKEEGKQYSLLSCIFNCFYENKKLTLSKLTINDYIHQDVCTYKNKMIVSFVENGTNSMETINESNYLKKFQTIISRNKCLVVQGDNISIDLDFVHNHKLLIYRNLFGKEIDIVKSSLKKRKIKTSLGPKKIVKNIKKISAFAPHVNNSNRGLGMGALENDYEIGIVETENDDTDITHKKIYPRIPPLYNNRPDYTDYNINQLNYINNNNNKFTNELRRPQFLEKKRRSEIYIKKDIDPDERSVIENGKFFLSLFKDKEMLNIIEQQNKSMDNNDNYVRRLLQNYENGSYLKNYLLMLNVDFNEFQRSIKNLIIAQESLNKSENDKFLVKFTVMNNIIMAKEKCNLLIDKIIIKLKQLILEYNFIKKVLGNIDVNKNNNFMKFKEVMSNVTKKQEKENYFGEVKSKLQEELSNAIIIGKNK